MKFCSYLSITFTSNTVLAFMNLPYHISDSRNDGNAHCVARHFVEPTVRKTCCDGLVELFISKALKPPAFNRHELSDPASCRSCAVMVNISSSGSLNRLPCCLTVSLSGLITARGFSSIKTPECSPRLLLIPESCLAVMHLALSVTTGS